MFSEDSYKYRDILESKKEQSELSDQKERSSI